MQRQPVVAGQFYPGSFQKLKSTLVALVPESSSKKHVYGIISPHAGYVYSGAIAGQLYAQIKIPRTVLIIGPSHTGAGAPVALYPDGEWLTPLGMVPINSRLNSLLLNHVSYIQSDGVAHQHEHSLEVQVPFIQYLCPEVSISAICLGRGDYLALSEIGKGIAEAIREYDADVLIVASSDMTHYESADSVRLKDGLALDKVLAFDVKGLLEICQRRHITMCGVAPSAVMIEAARELGATVAEVVAYGNSGDVSGDNQQVVGYAGVTVY
jgi:AmmeMemoRadiSam system protein B